VSAVLRATANKGFDQLVGHASNETKCPPTGQSRRYADALAVAGVPDSGREYQLRAL